MPQIETSKLVYFAASVFWKGAARRWSAVDHAMQLAFGANQERFRQFLLGEASFPDRAALIINVSGDPAPHIAAIYPYGGGRTKGTRQYRFAIPGMAFWLHFGQIPDALRMLCAHHSGNLCLAPNLNEMYERDLGALIDQFAKRQKLT